MIDKVHCVLLSVHLSVIKLNKQISIPGVQEQTCKGERCEA